jgi:hypothetical protein
MTPVLKGIGVFADSTFHGIAKDSFNTMAAYSAAEGRLHQPIDSSVQGALNIALGGFVQAWKDSVSGFTSDVFNGSDASISTLGKLIQQGVQLPFDNSTFSGLEYSAEKILYSQLIPVAWNKSPVSRYPFVLYVPDRPHQPLHFHANHTKVNRRLLLQHPHHSSQRRQRPP